MEKPGEKSGRRTSSVSAAVQRDERENAAYFVARWKERRKERRLLRWLAKAAVQGALSRLPRSARLNLFVKHRLGLTPDLRQLLAEKSSQTSKHIEFFRSVDTRRLSEVTVCEIGTGTYPIMPVLLWLLGIRRVLSVDIVRIANERTIRDTLELVIESYFSDIVKKLGVTDKRLAELRDRITSASRGRMSTLLAEMGIELVIADLSRDASRLNECDLIISNNVFEHISPGNLQLIVQNTVDSNNRPRLASHEIDLSDHYSHFDSKIGPHNFLKYSHRAWGFFNNKLAYQNRLRASDYRKIFAASGWSVEAESVDLPAGFTTIQNRVHPEFHSYELSDLAVTQLWIGARARRTP